MGLRHAEKMRQPPKSTTRAMRKKCGNPPKIKNARNAETRRSALRTASAGATAATVTGPAPAAACGETARR